LALQNHALACAGCSFSKMSSRLRGVSIFTITRKKPHFCEPPVPFDGALLAPHAALACSGCSFLPKMLVLPRRRAHFTYPRSEFTIQRELEPLSALSSPTFSFSASSSPTICALRCIRVLGPSSGWRILGRVAWGAQFYCKCPFRFCAVPILLICIANLLFNIQSNLSRAVYFDADQRPTRTKDLWAGH